MNKGIEKPDMHDLIDMKLRHALLYKNFQLAKQMVEQGAGVRAYEGREPLHILAMLSPDYLEILSPNPFIEVIQLLLNVGADLDALDAGRDPPLYHAYIQDSSLIFRLLVKAGADLSGLDHQIGTDMRHFLARVLHRPDDEADLDYLPSGVDVNATDLRGNTYLHRAVWLGSPSAVKALLRHGADPNERGHRGWRPLRYAFNLMQHPDGAGAVKALIDAGAEVNAMEYFPPLSMTISYACPPAFRIMFASRRQASAQTFCFSDHFLCAPEGTDAVIDVIEAGVPLTCDSPQAYGRVLCRAAQRGSLKAARWQLKGRAGPSARDERGRTPLHYSAYLMEHPGGDEALSALIQAGALVDATDSDGRTPLQLAVAQRCCRAVRFLLGKGAAPGSYAGPGTLGPASLQLIAELLGGSNGIIIMFMLIAAGVSVECTLQHHDIDGHSRLLFLTLIREARKVLSAASRAPLTRKTFLAFLSKFYNATKIYPSDATLDEYEIDLMEDERPRQGGFSDCYEGVFLGHHRVAMKALRSFLKDDVAERRLNREMGTWSQLHHPNILPFIGKCTLGDTSYIVSPWMSNGDAPGYINRRPGTDRLRLLMQVADGLNYLHNGLERPVIHGDLRAANILVSDSGDACIADFGLSELKEGDKPPRYSTEWYCAGHPRWQAPEILTASTKEDARRTKETDCFSYGRVMLELFTGKIPFFYLSDCTCTLYIIMSKGGFPERPLGKDVVARGLDDSMWELMKSCWSIDPTQRPSAAIIADHLKAASRNRPGGAKFDIEGSASPKLAECTRLSERPIKVEGI
ncbi:hypothetical protein BOTBODRAFT_36149 [Botryobasidium botryosum FD-172 SS1]|uniref:Protein kinase domain-containing protein n=1 Tax=Botryobasidium botryosum (strain FD-172 SS1) TaxID=930990 RepID=A0A067MF14_BOTB1|nr:hypothetical protein BOTBODRAFT_36149 [Botryobasidium botryosum FD-172 SS1]